MSAKPDLWMPLHFGAYLTDTMHLSTEQHGAYFLMLMACWKRGGDLPDDDAQLAAITRLSASQWRKARQILAPFWKIGGGKWTQKRLTKELETARGYVKAQSENGKKGGRPPKTKEEAEENPNESQEKAKPEADRKPDETPLPKPLQTPFTGTDSPTPKPTPDSSSRKRSPKTALPADFAISQRVTAWAEGKHFDHLDEHLEAFVSKVRQHGYTYVDWDEAFMSAIRDDWARLRNGRGAHNGNGAAFAEAERRIFGPQEKDVSE